MDNVQDLTDNPCALILARIADDLGLDGIDPPQVREAVLALKDKAEAARSQALALALSVMSDNGNSREPLTSEQVVMDGLMMCPSRTLDNCADAFEAGVRFAERAHGIGAV